MKYLLILILFASCSQSKRIQKAKSTLDQYPVEAAKYCLDKFPIQSETIYTPGATLYDTLWQDRESSVPFNCPPSDTVKTYEVKIKWKDREVEKIRIDTFRTKEEDPRKLLILNNNIQVLQDKNKELQTDLDKANKFITWFWFFVAAVVLALAIWIYFRIRAGALTSILSQFKR